MSAKQFININNKYDRVVVLVDMDCFYCQVEEKLNPEIRGKPIAVVQYNPWQGGGIIAVNYPARAKGVTRHMRGDEAKQHCPDIVLPQVPQVRGKADTTKYREAGKEVAAVLQTFTPLLERASVDEAYMDITERVLSRLRDMNEGKFQLLPEKLANTFAVGYESVGEFVQKISGDLEGNGSSQELVSEEDRVAYKKSDIKLLIGASIVNEIRAAVKEKTGYECSAGIAHNKILAKLTAGFHKPNKQTILPLKSIPKMYETLSIKKVKGLGGKLGEQVCDVLKIQFMSELTRFTEKVLQTHFEERMGSWMYLIAKGIELEAVTPKFNSKSIGCCKRFPGRNAITGLATLKHWLGELSNEIQERLEKDTEENNRTAKQMTVSYAQQFGESDVSSTRSLPLVSYDAEKIAGDALEAIKRNTDTFLKPDSSGALNNPVKFLGISAGKFEDNSASKKSGLKEMFSVIAQKAMQGESAREIKTVEEAPLKKTQSKKDIKSFFRSPTIRNETCDVPCKDNTTSCITENGEDCNETQLVETTVTSVTSESKTLDVDSSTDAEPSTKTFKSEQNCDETANNNYHNSTLPLDDQVVCEHTNSSYGPNAMDTSAVDCGMDGSMTETAVKLHKSNSLEIKTVDSINLELECVAEAENLAQNTSESSSTVADYRQTYAEYSCAPIIPEPARKSCPQCGKSVPEIELQSHLDFHVALQLSQQQREEFRNEIKTKFTSPASKPKPSNRIPKGKLVPIDKFLTTRDIPGEALAESSRCDECGKNIPTTSLQEHMDYHAARKLQLELNQMEMRTTVSNGFTINTGGTKRKRPSNSGKEQSVHVNSLSSYFTKM